MKSTSPRHTEGRRPSHPRRSGTGHLRITGGIHGSRHLEVPPIPGLRPAQDRVRAAVFSALANWIAEARILDLFAGTGAYGLEALSRGAKTALFIEHHHRTVECLRNNLESLGYPFPVVETPVENWMPTAPSGAFDLIFLDPPYDQIPEELSSWKITQGLERLLAPGGRIIWEHPHRAQWTPPTPLREVWRREYGQTCVSFLAHALEGSPSTQAP